MAHFSRKCYSTVKQQLEDDAGYSPLLLSEMDTGTSLALLTLYLVYLTHMVLVFMATYAAGNIINGKLGDTFNPTTILAIGLFGSGACLFLINVAIWFDFKGINSLFGDMFILFIYFLFGFFQATGGPVGTAVRYTSFLYHTTQLTTAHLVRFRLDTGNGKLVRPCIRCAKFPFVLTVFVQVL